MEAVGVVVRDIGVRAFNATCKICSDEQVKDSVDAIRGDPAVLRLRNGLGDIVGAGGAVERSESIENRAAHVGPLFALALQPRARRHLERVALVKLMIVA